MRLNAFFIIFFILLFTSCNTIFSKKEKINTSHKIIEEQINYSSIDAYPLLPECKSITERIQQKECFYKSLTSRIQHTLDNTFLEFPSNIKGTILVKIKINANGKASIKTIILANTIKDNIPKLDSLIFASVAQLPLLEPAIKTGIPVTSEFTLPIVINSLE